MWPDDFLTSVHVEAAVPRYRCGRKQAAGNRHIDPRIITTGSNRRSRDDGAAASWIGLRCCRKLDDRSYTELADHGSI